MSVREEFDLPAVGGDSAVYGTPYRTSEGVTVIPVTRPAGRLRPARAVGIFTVEKGGTGWHAATDDTAVALAGILVGLVATILSLVAVIKRPPWPDLRIHRVLHGR
ncbi:MAG: hypothetical protein J2P18_21075 [Nocardia sp.]|nr:hypothetical protein [Nocardia sp.]